MVIGEASEFFVSSDNLFGKILLIAGGLIYMSLLIIALVYPSFRRRRAAVTLQVHPETTVLKEFEVPHFKKIAVAMEFGTHDEKLIAHAVSQGTKDSTYILIHVVESATAKVMGDETDDLETRKDLEQLEFYVQQLKQKGVHAEPVLGYRNRTREIVRIIKEKNVDLLVIGAHGHHGIKDWLYGQTIDSVRHEIKIPVLVVNV
jgi:manganese transport protein